MTRKLLPEIDGLLKIVDRLKLRERVKVLGSEFEIFLHLPCPDGKARKIEHLRPMIDEVDSIPAELIESSKKRNFIASVLRQYVDSLFALDMHANIIIMGDFNDEPLDESVLRTLDAKTDLSEIIPGRLYNLSYVFRNNNKIGSIKYKGNWFMFDQFIVSASLLQRENQLYLESADIHLFSPDFLLEEDNTYYGFKPYRTYNGYRYKGGVSDHLPIYIDLRGTGKIIK